MSLSHVLRVTRSTMTEKSRAFRSWRMPSRNRRSPPRTARKGNWLRSDEPPRSRPWAYEELLFGSSAERGKAKEADEGEPDEERAELARLEQALDVVPRHVVDGL